MTETRHGKIPDWYNKDSEYEDILVIQRCQRV